jgi:type IV pilus assembly protein PilB
MPALTKFGLFLVDKGYFAKDFIDKVNLRLHEFGDTSPSAMARLLVTEYKVSHDTVYEALSKLYAFAILDIETETMEMAQVNQLKDLLQKFPDDFRKKLFLHKVFPYKLHNSSRETLVVLAADPTDKILQDIPLQTTFKRYEIAWTRLKSIEDLIQKIAPQKNEFLELLEEAGDVIVDIDKDDNEISEQELEEEINKSLLVNLFEGALVEAVRKDASDIHILPYNRKTVDVYFRIDGKLALWHRQENTAPEALAAVVKDRSNGVDRFERDTAQDGFAQRLVDDHLIRFRVSILPVVSAEYERRFESIVIRVIDDRKVIADFRKLGFQQQAEREFLKSINTSKGIIIVTGPTGSGKSTTLMAALHQIIKPEVNVLTCEDPVEYVIRGARQLKISHKMSFEEAIRCILRHDPDIVMVGEIRDKITADIAVKLANTGHLTFSTLHTNDAPSAVTRLYKMGIEPFLLAYSINIIIAQRLVRKLCNICKRPVSKENWKAALELGLNEDELAAGKIYEPVGCPKCLHGYKGRINIAEALYFYPEIRAEIVAAKNDINEERIRAIAEKHGMLSMRDSGIDRIREGLTSLEEVAYATSGEE